jgi:hypothetical protein
MAVKEEKNAIEDAVSDAVTDMDSDVVDSQDDEEKLDARANLFIRQVTDAVTKSIADLLQPAKPEPVAETIIVPTEPEDHPKPRQRKKQTSILDMFLRTVVS